MAKALGTESGKVCHFMGEKGRVVPSEKGKGRRLVMQVEMVLELSKGSIHQCRETIRSLREAVSPNVYLTKRASLF